MKDTRLIGFVAALLLLLASCDRKEELPDNELSSTSVAVRIRSMSVSEGGSESLGRSSLEKEPEALTTPVGDGMLLEMSVKEEEAPLRAPVELATGTHFRIIAVTGGTNYYSHGDYIYASGTLTPSSSTDFHVRVNHVYSYVCISYNDETLPSSSGYTVGTALPSLSYDNTVDLLWCKIEDPNPVPSTGVDLNIILKHQLTKVKVKLDCSYNGWKIGVGSDKVSIEDVASSGTIDLSTGNVTGSSPAPQTFASFTSVVDATSQTSNELTIMPKASSEITISILAGAVSRESPLTAIPASSTTTAKFTTALTAGVNYVITIRLRVPIWARSNIYWDDTTESSKPKLTFITASGTTNNQGFQGVFFKWGSLVGISPTGAFDNSMALYVPYNYTDATPTAAKWKQTTRNVVKNDTEVPSATENWTAWGQNADVNTEIPYMNPARGGTITGRGNTWLIDKEQNDQDTYQSLRGDICQYLGKTQTALDGYRLPTSFEFGTTNTLWAANQEGWAKAASFSAATGNAKGIAVITGTPADKNYAENTKMGSVIFPASGSRYSTTGALGGVGAYGAYWSGSANATGGGYSLYFDGTDVKPNDAYYRSDAFPIRCVKY
jgi:hypothetical protein